MSLKLVNHNPDLSQLRADGYDIAVRKAGHLLVSDVPYVNCAKQVKYGTIVCELDIAGEDTVAPKTHVAFFVGDYPCDIDGFRLPGVSPNTNIAVDKDLQPNHQMSRKPTQGPYRDFYHKMTTYIDIVSGPAQTLKPGVTAKTNPVVVPEEGESVFNYIDTAATKSGIVVANHRLESGKLAIVGVGGTGSYILDLVAKTPVEEIHIFDNDDFLNHNAFRSPGAASLEELTKKYRKVVYFASVYGRLRKNIVPHDCYIDESNVDALKEMNFVFLCIDRGLSKRLIIERLEEWSMPFIDVGMGIQLGDDNSLGGILTATTGTAQKRDHLRRRIAFSDGEANNEYSRNVQIADLNALNAILAVIKWKKLRGYYRDYGKEHFCSYTIDTNEIANEDLYES